MIVDGHAHCCGEFSTGEKIIRYLDENKIDKVVLCAGELGNSKSYSYPMVSDIIRDEDLGYIFNKIICMVAKMSNLIKTLDDANKYVYDIAKKSNGRIINVYWANPLEANCLEKINDFYVKYNFKMLKLHQCWTKFSMEEKSVENIINWAEDKKMPIFVHLISREEVKNFIKVCNKYKNVTFIVAHMIGFSEIARNSKNNNIYFDLSSPEMYPLKTLEKALRMLGSEKLIIGSDTPFGKDNIKKNINRLEKIALSKDEINNITGDNICKILKM